MRVGLIDVDGHNFPNIPLMKISAWHKQRGDSVEWYEPFNGLCEKYDKVYMSKVFSFTPDYEFPIYADEVNKGGTGYAIELIDGREHYDKAKDKNLPDEIEHIYPDYSLYPELTKDTAYGFLTRGCPRGCGFCIVAGKEGRCSHKVADLSEFWNGQKNLVLCDPNILACKEHLDLLQQIVNSKARVEFNQGLDVRMITEKNIELLKQMKLVRIHFAWDRYEDKDLITRKLTQWTNAFGVKYNRSNVICYTLCNFDTTMEQNLERIYWLRERGISPYVMLYNSAQIPKKHILRKLQRWVNNRFIFWSVPTFDEYMRTN